MYTWDHSFSKYTKFSEKLTVLIPWYAHIKGVKDVSLLENFAYVLNEQSQILTASKGLLLLLKMETIYNESTPARIPGW